MMLARYAEIVGALLTVLAPLLGVPLTVMIFYLRGLKEQLRGTQAELLQRMETLEHATQELRREGRAAERDFATKEEWLREVLHTRRQLERLAGDVLRVQLILEGRTPLPAAPAASARTPEPPDRESSVEEVHHGQWAMHAGNPARA